MVDKLHREPVRITHEPEMKERLLAQCLQPVVSNPAQISVALKTDFERWSKLVKDGGITVDK